MSYLATPTLRVTLYHIGQAPFPKVQCHKNGVHNCDTIFLTLAAARNRRVVKSTGLINFKEESMKLNRETVVTALKLADGMIQAVLKVLDAQNKERD